jgi:outer membrane protein, heavy metal efflux system
MKQKILTLFATFSALTVIGQQSIDSVLSSVERNNKSLIAGTQYWESQRLSFKTGTTLYDPNISLDYMKGRPVTAGNQLDFTATQAFDFPTVYANKKQLAQSQSNQGEFQLKALKQDVLLETKLVCLELIFLNRQNATLKTRILHAEKLMADIDRRISSGDGTALELNKVRINLVQLQTELRMNEGEVLARHQHLSQLNGGLPIL